MKRAIITATMILILIGFGGWFAIGGDNAPSGEKVVLKKVTPAVEEVYSNIVKTWKNPATGKWEFENVDAPKITAANTTNNSPKKVQQLVAESEVPVKIGYPNMELRK